MTRTAQIIKEKRKSIITLRHESQPIWNISRTLKVSSSAVEKTIKRYDETGSHEDRHRNGRHRVTSAAEHKFIRELPASEIAAQINASQSSSNRHISTLTAQRRLYKSGLHGRISAKKPLLKDANKKKRLAWHKKHKQWTLDQWKSVLFSDESKCVIFGSNRLVFERQSR